MSAHLQIQLVAAVVAVACALPGTFLVLRRMAMMSDAISHSILLGIVLAFFVVQDLASPWLIAAATLAGLATVALVELLQQTRLVKEDAAIGLTFPILFSLGVLLIAQRAGSVHLDTDAVLLGELAFAPLNPMIIAGQPMGPRSLWVMGGILLLNLTVITLFYKELKLATFDPALAAALGLAPVAVHYGLMALVSVTAVGAFDAVGSVLVVALMVGPPATAWLLTDKLGWMLAIASLLGVIAGIAGYWLAVAFDISIAGSMATVVGLEFLLVWLFAPARGLLASARRGVVQRERFARLMMLVHLLHHESRPEAAAEMAVATLHEHLRWSPAETLRVIEAAVRREQVRVVGSRATLTAAGRAVARQALEDFGAAPQAAA